MLIGSPKIGDILECYRDLGGVSIINKGDKALYLGHSQIKILTGPSKDWIYTLLITAPFVVVCPN